MKMWVWLYTDSYSAQLQNFSHLVIFSHLSALHLSGRFFVFFFFFNPFSSSHYPVGRDYCKVSRKGTGQKSAFFILTILLWLLKVINGFHKWRKQTRKNDLLQTYIGESHWCHISNNKTNKKSIIFTIL